jgi:IS1 family transposase
MANVLPLEKRTQIIQLLVDGNSLRATSHIADVSINTVTKLLVDVGRACQKFQDETVKSVKAKRVQCDEIWSFVYSKQKNVPEGMEGQTGDIWTWIAIDVDSKLIISYGVGGRDAESADYFMHDVADRLANAVQLTIDGRKAYLQAVDNALEGPISYAELVKIYGPAVGTQSKSGKKYSPMECTGCEIKKISGNLTPEHISTSYVDRQNLTMRTHMRRFPLLTNALSKKIENHCCAISLHFVYYNFAKIHKTLRVTPAMQAGLADRWMEISEIVQLPEKYSN